MYSTLGGVSANDFFVTMPQASRSSRRWDNVRGLIPCKDLSNSLNLFGPEAKSRSIKADHLLPRTDRAVARQPSLDSISEQSIFFILYFV